MSGPRTKGHPVRKRRRITKAVRQGARERAEIERLWLEQLQRYPFRKHTPKSLAPKLPFDPPLSLKAIYWHMDAIRREQDKLAAVGLTPLEHFQWIQRCRHCTLAQPLREKSHLDFRLRATRKVRELPTRTTPRHRK